MKFVPHVAWLRQKRAVFSDSPVAGEMGTLYPFIQGGMSWITDVPEFAARVADAGGLPTIALGMMDAENPRPETGMPAGDHGGAPVCRESHLLGGKPFPGDASAVDQEAETPFCRDRGR